MQKMKTLVLIFVLFIITIRLFCQYSINGVIVVENEKSSLVPLSNVNIDLIEKGKLILTDKNGCFSFNDLEPGTYSIKISLNVSENSPASFNRLIISNILLTKSINLDTIKLLFYYEICDFHYLTNMAPTISSEKALYSINGSFIIDTIGLSERKSQNETISSFDSVQFLLREGKWIWKNHVAYYERGKFNGKFSSYYSEDSLKCQGNFRDNIRNGEWIYYNESGEIDFIINFQDGYLMVDQKGFSIKDYNHNIYKIYSD